MVLLIPRESPCGMTSSISGFPRMSRYRDFSCLVDVNIQTHFQLEKHIVFYQMINHIDLKCERKM